MTPPTLTQVQGVFTRSLSSFTARAEADAAGYRAVAVQLVNTPLAAANVAELTRMRPELKARGWLVGGWGTFGQDTTDVIGEGRLRFIQPQTQIGDANWHAPLVG